MREHQWWSMKMFWFISKNILQDRKTSSLIWAKRRHPENLPANVKNLNTWCVLTSIRNLWYINNIVSSNRRLPLNWQSPIDFLAPHFQVFLLLNSNNNLKDNQLDNVGWMMFGILKRIEEANGLESNPLSLFINLLNKTNWSLAIN